VRRCAWIAVLTSLPALVPATAATAGGWDSLHFPDDHYLVGEVASTTQLFYAARLKGMGELDGGPYYAYLLPPGDTNSMGLGMIDPPNIPRGALRLGAIDVSGPFHRAGYGGPYGRASLRFTVPDVPTGRYSIGFCDDPCRHGYIGWMAWASITIVHTEDEARLLAALDRRAGEMRQLRSKLRRSERLGGELEDQISSLGAEVRERTMSLRAVGARLTAARARRPGSRPVVTWWQVALLPVALVIAGVVVRRRRRPDVVVPDAVPDDLIERDHAGL
jgi:hypothetical protein